MKSPPEKYFQLSVLASDLPRVEEPAPGRPEMVMFLYFGLCFILVSVEGIYQTEFF